MTQEKAQEVVAEIGRFQVTRLGEMFTLLKDGVAVESKFKTEILSNKKDWKGMVPEYTVASMLLESWMGRKENYVNTNVQPGE